MDAEILKPGEEKSKESSALVGGQPNYVDNLLAQAIQSNIDLPKLEKFIELRSKLKAEAAKEAFDEALADFQADCPVIVKDKHVKFATRDGGSADYKYAPLDSIIEQVKGSLGKNGLSYSFKLEELSNGIRATCILKHRLGHFETGEFLANMVGTKMMSEAQITASKATFAKRQAFCNVTGIVTGDDDNDAARSKEETKVEALATEVQRDEIDHLALELGMEFEEVSKRFQDVYKMQMKDMTSVQAQGVIQGLKDRKSKK